MTPEGLEAFLSTYGYWFFFAVGFAEFIGIPIVSIPVVIAGGAVAASGSVQFLGVVAAVATGGLLADLIWSWKTRLRGQGLIDVACGLSSNPKACVIGVKSRLTVLGVPYILFAKLLPGAGNLIAPAAGLACFRARVFVLADSVALVLWGTLYAGIGWVFRSQVESAIAWVLMYSSGTVGVAVTAVLGATLWRVYKVRRHQGAHRRGGSASTPGSPVLGGLDPTALAAPSAGMDR